jgi:hypothetical protein
MTNKEIDKLSLKEAKDKLRNIYRKKSVVETYLTIESKMESFSKQFDEVSINIADDEDESLFDRMMKFSKESLAIQRAQEERLTMIDEDELIKARKERNQAGVGTVEDMIKKMSRTNDKN